MSRSDRLGAVPEKPGPEIYAPNRKPVEKLSDADQAAATFEGEIREFVRRDVDRCCNNSHESLPEGGIPLRPACRRNRRRGCLRP